MAYLFDTGIFAANDSSGASLSGAKLTFYDNGTTTLKNTYPTKADAEAGTNANANPVVADANGRWGAIWLDDTFYTVKFQPSDGSFTRTRDDIGGTLADLVSTASGKGSELVGHRIGAPAYVKGTVGSALDGEISASYFGIVGDGATFNSTYWDDMLTDAQGMRVRFGLGNYVIDADTYTAVGHNIALSGTGVIDGNPTMSSPYLATGSNLFIFGDTNSPITNKRGFTLEKFGVFYPDQVDSATPAVYPPFIDFNYGSGAVQAVYIRDNFIYNCYDFLRSTSLTGSVGHVWIQDNKIGAINRGIYFVDNAEHVYVAGNEFTLGGWVGVTDVWTYTKANAVGIQLDNSDGFEIRNNLFFGMGEGVTLGVVGHCGQVNVTGNNFDQVLAGYNLSGTGSATGILSDNNFIAYNNDDHAAQGRAVVINASGATRATLSITSNQFGAASEEMIYIYGTSVETRDIIISDNTFLSWAAFKSSGDYAAIYCEGSKTNLIVSSNWFVTSSGAYASGIKGNFNTLQLVGNTFEGPMLAALNCTVGDYTASGNRSYNISGTYSNNITCSRTNFADNNSNAWDKPKVWSVASATALDITGLGDFITVTGTTNITSITGGARVGRVIRLLFSGVLTFTDGSNLKLNGNFTTSADDIITLISDGTNWYETGRSAN